MSCLIQERIFLFSRRNKFCFCFRNKKLSLSKTNKTITWKFPSCFSSFPPIFVALPLAHFTHGHYLPGPGRHLCLWPLVLRMLFRACYASLSLFLSPDPACQQVGREGDKVSSPILAMAGSTISPQLLWIPWFFFPSPWHRLHPSSSQSGPRTPASSGERAPNSPPS